MVQLKRDPRSPSGALTLGGPPVLPAPERPAPTGGRIKVCGARFVLGERPVPIRGVTYGTFAARSDGELYPERAAVRADFEAMAASGVNVVRTYTLPPPDVLDAARENEIRVFAGLVHHDWRTERGTDRAARSRVRAAAWAEADRALERLAGDPIVFGVSVGNEYAVDLVRMHTPAHVAATLGEMVDRLHEGDPDLLVTYVNFPTTEFLQVPGIDFAAYNVFLDDPAALRAYLQRLQVTHEGIPLVVSELGVAGAAGPTGQALADQLEAVDAAGCAGAFVFSWTDDWCVGGVRVEGWSFGLTDENRLAKPPLGAFSRWARREVPVELRAEWPRLSAVVCAYNEERNIDRCVRSLLATGYPDLEVIVCDDGSEDRTAEIAEGHPVTVIRLPRGGLSRARNAGLEMASGDIVAYLDADAECSSEWPFHLALSLEDGAAATGGPNVPFPDAGFVERAVAACPGNPRQVLLSHDRAEHVPGCNMAFRREVLAEVGGFDPRYRTAGDDVDLCWRLVDAGHRIAYAPAALVYHHRRATVRGYLRQQRGYGRAERLLADVHGHRFNRLGQARWSGTVYGMTPLLPRLLRPVVYTGWAGQAPYQTVELRRAERAAALATALVPVAAGAALLAGVAGAATGARWLAASVLTAVVGVVAFAVAVALSVAPARQEAAPWRHRALVGALHVAQPLARTWGRVMPAPQRAARTGHPWPAERGPWLASLSRALGELGVHTTTAPSGAGWDLRAGRGLLALAYVNVAVVWSWEARARVRYRPTVPAVGLVPSAGAFGWGIGGPAAVVVAVAAALVACLFSLVRLRSRINVALSATAPHWTPGPQRANASGRRSGRERR